MTEPALAVALGFALLGLVVGAMRARSSQRRAAEAAARATAETAMLRAVVDGIPDAVLVLGRDRELVVVNPAARLLFGETLGARLGDEWPEQLGAYTSDGARMLTPDEGCLPRAMKGETVDDFRMVLRAAHHAQSMHMSAASRPILDASGALVACLAVWHDVSDAHRGERRRQQTEERFRRLAEATFEGIALSVDGIVLDSNETYARMLGYEPEQVLGRDATDFIVERERDTVSGYIRDGSEDTYETVGLRQDGSEVPLEVRGRMLEVDGIRLRITAMRDVSDRKRDEAKLAEQAEALRAMAIRDELTGLYNRRGFHELGEQQLRLADRADRVVGLVFADVNGLKKINDELGHDHGDQLIRDAAAVLAGVARSADLVARLGGDEFVVLASGLHPENVAVFAGRLSAAIAEHNASARRPYQLSLSIGVAHRTPRSARTLEELLAEADERMYVQKRAGGVGRDAAA